MGKFINTTRKDTIDSLVTGLKSRLDNPYYVNAGASPTIVNYFSTNLEQTTLDQGIKTEYEQVGENSPFKYNLIKDFYLYGGLDHIQVDLDLNDTTGLEAAPIISRSTILPNIGMVPAVGDHFEITYMNNSYIFEVITVNTDKLENQSNMYEIEYELTDKTNENLMKQVANTFIMNIDNLGTSLRVIIKEDAYNLIEVIDQVTTSLKNYFINIFFSPRVETFVYDKYCGRLFYDPHLIEFIIRNEILKGSTEYIHVTQQMAVSKTFFIDYDNTFFRSLETRSIDKFRGNVYGWGKHINQPTSILSMNKEDYYEVKHVNSDAITQNPKFIIFDEDLIRRIDSNQLYGLVKDDIGDVKEDNLDNRYTSTGVINSPHQILVKSNVSIDISNIIVYRKIYNMIIKYFNDFIITKDDIDALEDIDYYTGGETLYYIIPIIIFILEQYALDYLSNPDRNKTPIC